MDVVGLAEFFGRFKHGSDVVLGQEEFKHKCSTLGLSSPHLNTAYWRRQPCLQKGKSPI